MADAGMTIDEVREHFAKDHFATDACGCEVIEAWRGHSVCAFDIEERHRNQLGAVMGGAIFTLADFAMAIASNVDAPNTVSVSNTIEYLSSTRGTRLIATCDADREGGRLAFYTAVVTDDLGRMVARMVGCGMRL